MSCIALHAGETKSTLNGLLSDFVRVTGCVGYCYVIALIFFKILAWRKQLSLSGFVSEVEAQGRGLHSQSGLTSPHLHPSTCCLLNHCDKKYSVKAGHQNESF